VLVDHIVELREPEVLGLVEFNHATSCAFPDDVHINTQVALICLAICLYVTDERATDACRS
jgi:hypothetical protein